MKIGRIFMTVMAGVVLFIPSVFAAQEYQVDKAHSSIAFSITHLMISQTTGVLKEFDGNIAFAPEDLAGARFDFTVQAASVDTQNEARDAHIKGPDFFDAVKFPVMTLTTKKVAALGEGKYSLTGDLTIKDVTKEVVIPIKILGPVADPFGKGTAIGISSTFQINRQDFHINWNKKLDNGGLMVGDVVDVTVNLEAHSK